MVTHATIIREAEKTGGQGGDSVGSMAEEPWSEELFLKAKENPLNWSPHKKWLSTLIIVCMTASISFCSSIYTAAIVPLMGHFNSSETVTTLGVTTFLLGFASGPLLFAPLSEIWGRNPVYRGVLALFVLFQIGCALAPNMAAMLVFRFFSGFFGSPTVTNAGGSLADIWPQNERSVPFALFSAASFLGPVIAPIIGGFVTQYTIWRWNFWMVLLLGGSSYVAMFFFLSETYGPKLLRNKLRGSRRHGHQEQNLKDKYYTNLTRPWIMLFTEPILFSLSLYMAFVYGILYLDFTAYPIVFGKLRHWDMGRAGLSFIGMALGMGLATAGSPLINRLYSHYVRKLSNSGKAEPEARLPHLIILSWLIPISLFWFAWTGPPVHWAPSIVSGLFFGVGLVTLFLGITAYLTDCYAQFSASALAANAVFRSLFGAVFPLFAKDMYDSLGTAWAGSLLGFIAIALAPLPWIFFRFGPQLRRHSQYHRKTIASQ